MVNRLEVGGELRAVVPAELPRALGESVGRSGADGARAAHDHVANGIRRFAKVARGDDFELMRQQPLLDEPDGIAAGVKGDGAAGVRPAADGDIHGGRLSKADARANDHQASRSLICRTISAIS